MKVHCSCGRDCEGFQHPALTLKTLRSRLIQRMLRCLKLPMAVGKNHDIHCPRGPSPHPEGVPNRPRHSWPSWRAPLYEACLTLTWLFPVGGGADDPHHPRLAVPPQLRREHREDRRTHQEPSFRLESSAKLRTSLRFEQT